MLRTQLSACKRVCTLSGLTKALKFTNPNVPQNHTPREIKQHIHTSSVRRLDKDIRGKKNVIRLAQSLKLEGSVSEDFASEENKLEGLTEAGVTIPTLETHKMLVNGIPYCELPICHIKSSPNNTIMLITDHSGKQIILRNSCGMEGFKHVKKSTNVAAQATGLSLGLKAIKQGVPTVRVVLKGIGAGRMASIKGLQMSGMQIISITDATPLPYMANRPRKIRRL